MVGHLSVPALDPTPAPIRDPEAAAAENPYGVSHAEGTLSGTAPATLSAPIIEGLLRRDLGFKGLVITDAMEMGGVVAHYDAGEAAVGAIEAGGDQIVQSRDTGAAVAAVRPAVRGGWISERRIEQSVPRILDAKRRTTFAVG